MDLRHALKNPSKSFGSPEAVEESGENADCLRRIVDALIRIGPQDPESTR